MADTEPYTVIPDQFLVNVTPGHIVRRLAGLHDVSHVHLAEFIGSAKQTLGPILAGKKGLGKDLTERLAGAFYLPPSLLLDGNLRLALAAGLLTMDTAPIAYFAPREGEHLPEYRDERIAASKNAAEEARTFHAAHPEVMKEAYRIVETIDRVRTTG